MAPTTKTFANAEAERLALRQHVEFLEVVMTGHPTTALSYREVDQYLTELAETRKLIGPSHTALLTTAPRGTDMTPYTADYRDLLQLASQVDSGLYGIKMSLPQPATASSSSSAASSSSSGGIKLPRLELPKFSGNLQEWVSFRDLFVTAIHNSSLSKVEKLTQLKSLLTGEAARQVRSLPLSEANYDIAWDSLKQRYENNRELLFSILKRLINQPIISSATAVAIRSLLDTTKECIRSLEVLAIPTQHWDALLLYLLFSKLDNASRELWEQSLTNTDIPSLNKMFDFIEQRSRALAASSAPPTSFRQQGKPQQQQPTRTHHATTGACRVGCGQSHPAPLYKCPLFQRQYPDQRLETVKRLKACRNCLMDGHHASSCASLHTCKICKEKHHTMLHPNNSTIIGRQVMDPNHQPTPQPAPAKPPTQNNVQSHHGVSTVSIPTGILATARVNVLSGAGDSFRRSLVDGGSTNTQICTKTAKRLKLPLSPASIPMSGQGDTYCGTARHVTTFKFSPWFDPSFVFTITAIVVDKISGYIPSRKLNKEDWPHLNGLRLADPDFHLPEEVEILFGTDIFWTILDNEKIHGAEGQPHGIKTSLGWLVAGANFSQGPMVQSFNSTADLDYQLGRFFDQEEGEEKASFSKEEEACEQHFAATHQRDSVTGRYTVSLPFRSPTPELGSSRQAAIRRFLSLEAKYNNPKVKDVEGIRKLQQQWQLYKDFMAEYQTLNHMEEIPAAEIHQPNTYYIPHHAVFKESSTTTKLRVVFDASATTSTGHSLNDCLMVGPQLQDHIWDIMLRFRIHPIAFTADIEKMFRKIGVIKKHCDLQRIIWRANPSDPLKDYRLLTVTYGTGSAPYLAVKCLRQLAKDEKDTFPRASKVALRDFYMDDVASTCPTMEEAKTTVKELISLCMSGGMLLRKWTTNCQELLDTIPEELRETVSLVELYKESTVKTLGIYWTPKEDKYSFRISLPTDMPGKTKRTILTEIAKIYDPMGWLAPAIIVCKMLMQDLWKTKHDWDESLPISMQNKWIDIRNSLRNLEKLEIPRCVLPASPSRLLLIGCSDASTLAISAAVYLGAEYDGAPPTCHLLSAKTKVAPIKLVTLPRLELNGAVLLSELMKATLASLQLEVDIVRAFTDSTITLHWVTSAPTKWKLYVRNRVQKIQDNVPNCHWFHISGERNPADCASRGISGTELINHPLWWHGVPEFFNPLGFTEDLLEEEISQLAAETQVTSHHTQPVPVPEFLLKFSSFNRLCRVIAYMRRFIKNVKRPATERTLGTLLVTELLDARNIILKSVQRSSYPAEYEMLSKKEPLPNNNHLLNLKPFVCGDGLVRVGGRLSNADLSYDRKHPILLPKGHHITLSIIRDLHNRNFHSGATATLANLQRTYWITRGRDTVRAIIRRCVTCTRHRGELMGQIMGDLPPHRVNPCQAFTKVGVDYAGPVTIKPMVRSKINLKCWLAVFVCLVTKAIHIEVVSSLSTECFLAALRRFVARRGKPSNIFSDCGTNFKGADKALRDFFSVSRQAAVQDECTSQEITWHFNPPGAPHFGGLWEAGVKSIKHHLVRVMGSTTLTYEELHTLVTQIEGILNSRPLVPASTDPADLEALTPAHFLIGRPITAVPEPDLGEVKENHLQRWQLLQQRQQLFWRRWSQEYLTRLQQRPKWMKVQPELQIGHMVLVKDERLPPLKWKLARVLEVHPGKDGHVRVATIKTKDGNLTRPIAKLTLLPLN